MKTYTLKQSEVREEATCEKHKKFDETFEDGVKGTVNPKAKITDIVKTTITSALKNEIAQAVKVDKNPFQSEQNYSRATREYMLPRYNEVGFLNYQQKQEQINWDNRRIMRYLFAEHRVPTFVPEKEIDFGDGLKIIAKPDIVFFDGTKVEFVILKNSKPTCTRTGKKGGFAKDIVLYANVLYARQLGYTNITASLYFLKKTYDCNVWARCDQEFFGNDNVIRMNDLYDGKPNDLDKEMASKIALLKNGQDSNMMSKETCEHCKFYDICKYEFPSLSEENEEVISSNKEVKYTDAQKAVINNTSGISRIIAAAGSGKTQTLAGRVAHLLESGVKPKEILCITFSNAGASEMRRKIGKQLVENAKDVEIENLEDMKVTTFHALEYEIAKDNFKDLGYERNLTVLNDVQKYSIIAKILKDHPIFEWGGKSFLNFTVGVNKYNGAKGALSIVSDIFSQIKAKGGDWKNMSNADIFNEDDVDAIAIDEIIKRFEYYEEACKKQGLIDFDDMELLSFSVIDNNENYLETKYGFKHVIIDEFQDSSEWQMQLIMRLVQMSTLESLMIIGDDAQAIYGFRDTTPDYILNFEQYLNGEFKYKTSNHNVTYKKNYLHVDDIFLTDNWRSKQEILDRASDLLEKNVNQISKKINAGRGNGGIVTVQGYKTEKEEAEAIATDIKAKIDAGMSCDDIAVLAYTKSELQKIASALTQKGIPSMFGAPEPLMENSRIRAILAFARVINNHNDSKDAAIVANAIYRAEDTTISTGLMDLKPEEVQERVNEVISQATKISNDASPAKQKEMFLEVISSLSLDDEAVEHFLEQFEFMSFDEVLKYCKDFELFGVGEEYRRIGDYHGVKLITAHSSKGLEWDVVYFSVNGVGKCFDGTNSCAEREEIRRLEFVAMTRARDELHVSGTFLRRSKLDYVTNIALYEMYNVSDMYSEWCAADKYPTSSRKTV